MRLLLTILTVSLFPQITRSQEPVVFDLSELIEPGSNWQDKLKILHKKYNGKTIKVTGPVSSLISDGSYGSKKYLFAISNDKDVLSDKRLHKAIAISIPKSMITKQQILDAQGKSMVTVIGKVKLGTRWQLIIDAEKIGDFTPIKE